MAKYSVADCSIIELDKHHSDRKGNLAVVENGDDLVARGEFRGEPDHADEGEQRDEKVDEVGNEVEVVARYDHFPRHIMIASSPLEALSDLTFVSRSSSQMTIILTITSSTIRISASGAVKLSR